jgi:hypothetical protein
VADTPDDDELTPVERLHDHLQEVSERPDEMQERLEELGESIDATRRQAEADDLLPGPEDHGDPLFDEIGLGMGDVEVPPVGDSDTDRPEETPETEQ